MSESRRDFLKAVGFIAGAGMFAACNLEKYTISAEDLKTLDTKIDNTPIPTQTPKKTSTPPITASPPNIETAQPIEDRFRLGSMDFGKTPFTLETTAGLMKAMGYSSDQTIKYHADFPLPVTVPEIASDEQIKIMDKAAVNNSAGNPYLEYITDRRNQLFISFHSLQLTSPGDLARDVGGKVYGKQEKLSKILGQKVVITPKEQQAFEAEIVYVATIPGDYYYEGDDKQYPWGWNPDYNLAREGLTDAFGIPKSVRDDKTPNTYYITIFSCQTQNPGVIPPEDAPHRRSIISANGAMLTLKFTLP